MQHLNVLLLVLVFCLDMKVGQTFSHTSYWQIFVISNTKYYIKHWHVNKPHTITCNQTVCTAHINSLYYTSRNLDESALSTSSNIILHWNDSYYFLKIYTQHYRYYYLVGTSSNTLNFSVFILWIVMAINHLTYFTHFSNWCYVYPDFLYKNI